jgi:hypothetical protein
MRAGTACFALAAFLATLGTGCGERTGPHVAATVAIKGKVTYNGKPLTRGSITFEPVDIGREANGEIQPDGTFQMSTFKANDGAVPGVHRVAVSGTGKVDGKPLPVKFQSPASSHIEIEVADGKTDYTIDLK